MSTDNFNDTTIGNIGKGVHYPKFSPDDKNIAFLRNNQVWIFDSVSSEEHQLTNTQEAKQQLMWTQDGNNILYSTGRELIRISITHQK